MTRGQSVKGDATKCAFSALAGPGGRALGEERGESLARFRQAAHAGEGRRGEAAHVGRCQASQARVERLDLGQRAGRAGVKLARERIDGVVELVVRHYLPD